MNPLPSTEIYIDGASLGNPGPAGIGVVFTNGQERPILQLSKYLGQTTNNVAEYLALIYALVEAHRRGFQQVRIKTDSELLAKQFNGQYKVRDNTLRLLHDLARYLAAPFAACSIEHISRSQNTRADQLAGEAVEARFDTSVKTVERAA